MLTLRFFGLRDGDQDEVLATLTLNDDLTHGITGEAPDVIELDLNTVAADGSGFVSFSENPVLWARSIQTTIRGPYLYTELIEDTFPETAKK